MRIAIKGKPAYVEAFGVADRDTGEALTPQHRFRIASISKPITSTGIFTLIEAGKLQLDSHVFEPNCILRDDYPTQLQHRSNIEQITIEHLLTHTTGGWQSDAGDPMGLDKKMNHRELIAFALEHNDLADPPGKSFAYSNFGYCLLGRVIEKVTGQTYEQYIKDNILRRCDISDMRIAGNTLEERAINEVQYYDQTGRDPYGMNVARMDSHGGWIATPIDFTAFFIHINGFKDTDRLLSDDTLRTMTTNLAMHGCLTLPTNSLHDWPGMETPNRSTSRRLIPPSRSVGRATIASRDRHSSTLIATQVE